MTTIASLNRRGNDIMKNKNAGQDRTLSEKIIRQKMVTVLGSKSTYK
jgi:hypothetical protein